MYRILVSDPLEATGIAMLRDAGCHVVELSADDKPRIAEVIPEFDALVVRSGTKVTADLLAAGEKLRVVGRAGIGVDNVDVEAATARGILVVNAPTANLISATEHTFALLLALMRKVPAADRALKDGTWDRKAFLGTELRGKTLGVIGFGRIGQRVARRAQAFEMNVLAYDPFLDTEAVRKMDVVPCTLDELLEGSDAITLHTPLTDATRNLVDAAKIAHMRDGAVLINCGRGGVVDEGALLEALEGGKLAGAGLDVFAQEPPVDYQLASHPKVVATPHVGAQTREAQVRVATDTAKMVLAALRGSLAITAVNLPFRPAGAAGEPFLRLAETLGRLASGLREGSQRRIAITLRGIEDGLHVPMTIAFVKGALGPVLGEGVNYVNAEALARERGIEVVRSVASETADYPHLVVARIEGEGGPLEVAGTLFHERDPRIVRIDDHQLEFRPEGHLLVLRNHDVPGVVGSVGTALGESGLNIADLHLSRAPGGEEALAVVRLDARPDDTVLDSLRDLPAVRSVRLVSLTGA